MAEITTHATEFEALLPKLIRQISPPADEDPLAHLPLAQLRVLRALATEAKSPCEVGEELGLSPSSVTQLANRLIEAGMVRKEDSPDDRRSKRLQLTELASEHLEQRHSIRVMLTARLLQKIPLESRESLLVTLRSLTGGCPCREPMSVSAQLEKGFEV